MPLRGPYNSPDRFAVGTSSPSPRYLVRSVLSWTDSAAFPSLPTDESLEVFTQLRRAPSLNLDDGASWRARPHSELHATNDKPLMKFTDDAPTGYWPVFKGESFDLWEPDTGTYYAWASPAEVRKDLQKSRVRANSRSVFLGFTPQWLRDSATLPCNHPRLAFRDVTRATDTRTVRCALLPPRIFVANTAPYFLWPRGDERDQAYLLGVLSSVPLDWWARRYVEKHLNFFVLNPLPIPRPQRSDLRWKRVVKLAGRLACPDERFAAWAQSAGVECGPLTADKKEDHINELDAVVAHLYGLTESHVRHIFETFHEGWDYHQRLEATLEHYRRWQTRL